MTDSKYSILASLIIPQGIPDWSEIELRYPKRDLPFDSKVVRVAPSPTGFAHFGLLFTATIDLYLARQTKGVFILRIEDTDKEREVSGATDIIINALHSFDLNYDEGPMEGDQEVGEYGPYIQSKRYDIYLSAARELIKSGHLYPCFCTEEELGKIRTTQEANKIRTGYYGEFATCRNMSLDQIKKNIDDGKTFVLRFRSPENSQPSTFNDSIKGKITLPANDVDYVLIKSNLGLPVYHLAAMIDDHLQKVNQVIRADEWLPSLPVHLQIIDAFGWTRPEIGHLSPIMKMDGPESKRKLSKRKDPEANAEFYREQGIPAVAVRSYILNIANSGFEDWRNSHQLESLDNYPFSLNHMGSSGALFDNDKFADICKQEISLLSADEVFTEVESWAKEFNPEFHNILIKDVGYSKKIFAIERSGDKKRKDISSWSQVPDLFGYFYDEIYIKDFVEPTSEHVNNTEEIKIIIKKYLDVYKYSDSRENWFDNLKNFCEKVGSAGTMKDYKNNPNKYLGHVGDIAMLLRMALSGRTRTPDLYEMMQAMGEKRVISRLKRFSNLG